MFIMILHFDITNITAITIIRFSRLDGGVERDNTGTRVSQRMRTNETKMIYDSSPGP